jgi:hypothetical protein
MILSVFGILKQSSEPPVFVKSKQLLSLMLIVLLSLITCCISNSQSNPGLTVSTDSLYTVRCANMTAVIDGKTGSRIISFKLGDFEILGSKKEHPRYYGSTLWLSPEGKWKGQGVLDASSYSLESYNGMHLSLKSKNDTLRGFKFLKQYQVNTADTSLLIKYTIINTSKVFQEVAPWEVTRVPTGGLAILPKRSPQDIPKPNKMNPLPAILDSVGMIWYPYDSSLLSSQKLFMDGSEGWSAYVYNQVLFIKKFPVINPDMAAPGEKNVELYVNKEKTYIELENQGIYQKLNSSDSLIYEVKWYARRLPSGIKIEPGSQSLLRYIRRVIKS